MDSYFWRDFWEDLGLPLSIIFLAAFVLISISAIIGAHMSFHGWEADIEQLRKDAANVDLSESEDIMGQVTEVNRMIKVKQKYNRIWWSSIYIPNGWEDIEPIEVQRR